MTAHQKESQEPVERKPYQSAERGPSAEHSEHSEHSERRPPAGHKPRKPRKEPFIRMARRDDISTQRAWAYRALAFVLALLTGALLILLLGHNPLSVYVDMVVGAWGTNTVIRETIKLTVPLVVTSLALALAFKMKFWNIGGEGQIIAGAVAAAAFGFFTADIFDKFTLTLLMLLAGMIAGGLYAMLPAIFKAQWNTNETLFTLMLNYVALAFVKFLMNGPWKAPGSSFPRMPMLVPGARMDQVFGVHWGWILALVLIVLAWFYFTRTKQGYEIEVVGKSENTARYAGISVKKVVIRTMFFSGALCGLVGMMQFAGADYTITEGITGGVGFTAITIAWLAKMNPFAIGVVSLFIAMLERGSNTIQTIYKIPASASDVLIGILLFFMIGCEFFIRYRVVLRGRGAAGAEPVEAGTAGPGIVQSAGPGNIDPGSVGVGLAQPAAAEATKPAAAEATKPAAAEAAKPSAEEAREDD